MSSLFVRDGIAIKKQAMVFIITILGMVIPMLFGPNGIYFTMAISGVNMAFLTLFLLSSDQENNGFKFLFTTPITRTQYVAEKFIMLFSLTISSFILTVIVMLIFNNTLDWAANQKSLTNLIALVSMAISIVAFLLIPLQIKFGPTKIQMLMSGIGALVAIILGAAYWIFTKTDFGKDAWDKLVKMYIDNGFTPFMIVAGIFTALILVLSYVASVRNIKRLEF
ncbi:ABC-2 transporter permease [Lentilactobacillus sp. Marseille-Q4993]|uniref:ABC-2 transporter permease n=1 Tax=Lentilactobacillus sp. Marseille-Q4993 TaxID=3039492 RepID=UPI0024BCAE5B|nr:ABC-2 transporter permease [Lentilactobacillus sp. Marseille-Q4993]